MNHENTLQDAFILPCILNAALLQIHFLIKQADSSDGRATATDAAARAVKINPQVPIENQTVLPSIQQVPGQALMQYPFFQTAFFPTRLHFSYQPIF